MTDMRVADNPAQQRYEIVVDGDLAGYAMYRDDDSTRTFVHTVVEPDYEGHGVGGALVRGALEDTRSRGLTIVARCPFVVAYLKRHPELA